MIRDLILTLTILGIISIAANQPAPVKSVQADYCVIDQRRAVKHPLSGEWMYRWSKGYGLCSQLDRYEEI